MSRWLYQMSERYWPSENYRASVRERRLVRWPTYKRMFADGRPAPGDIIICLYTPTGSKFAGVCGFGVITRYLPKSRRIDWLPLPPTDRLKRRPWWARRVEEILEAVRKKSPMGTMYQLPAALEADLRRGLFAWAKKSS